MNTLIRKVVALLGFFTLSALYTIASAQCTSGQPASGPELQKQAWEGDGVLAPEWIRKVVDIEADHDRDRGRDYVEPVVGFWRVLFVAKGTPGIPDGTVIDRTFAQWHADGTEFTNSAKPPISGSFCLGVWKKTGDYSYELNHFAIAWDNSGSFIGLGSLRQKVVVAKDRKSFVGTFTIDQYDQSGNNLLQHIQGDLVGQRVTTSTTIQDLI